MISIPGKTFLVGEYSVLVGGQALGLATQPEFRLQETDLDEVQYHDKSAAGLFCKKNKFSFSKKILNPYKVGGFGQSTAEFIFAWFHKNSEITRKNLQTLFTEYLSLYSEDQDQKIQPSGADLVTQVLGMVTHFKKPVDESCSYLWPFPNLSFFVISTGLKIQTHEHLQKLNRDSLQDLIPFSQNVIGSFLSQNEKEFIKHLNLWSLQLEQKNLQHAEVLKIKAQLLQQKNILLVKPCGALGADVCLVFCSSSEKNEVKTFLTQNHFHIQATEADLTVGVGQVQPMKLKDQL